ncbi:MAG: DUF4835 family protein [Limnohabitans sp.]|nr:DUF4835 family protein [Limnohabitans sp.]
MILWILYVKKWTYNPFLLLLLYVYTCIHQNVNAQELNCRVKINISQAVQITERRVFSDMERSFTQFINSRIWSSDKFQTEEKITCNLILSIEEIPSINHYKAIAQIVSTRPVYGTNYETITFYFLDRDWEFDYVESQPLEYNDNSFSSNIASLLAFYAYIIIGSDYDSFSKLGGNPLFEKSWQIINTNQSYGIAGWNQFGSSNFRSRYNLCENLLNQQMIPFREAFYEYHRLGMDIFNTNPQEARNSIVGSLKKIQPFGSNTTNTILPIIFMEGKNEELIHIFSRGEMNTRQEAYNILIKINPTNTEKYNAILQNKASSK